MKILLIVTTLVFVLGSVRADVAEDRSDYLKNYRSVDVNRAMSRLECLWKQEFGQTMTCKRRAAETVLAFLRQDGFSAVESIELPTDGKSSFHDKRMPFAWEATVGRLTVVKRGKCRNMANLWADKDKVSDVLADYVVHPFHLVKGSVATPPGGVTARVLSEAQFLAGEDAKGAMVMLEPTTWPRAAMLTPILDRGGIGFVSDQIVDRFETPDSIQWVTACTETASWSPDEETRPFVGFSVSPRIGAQMRAMAAAGGFEVKVECDGRRLATTMPFVTAVVPGRRSEEVWLLAHMYEPLASDDACGVVAAIETARRFIGSGKPEFTIRVLFGIEYYGYAAYLDRVGCPLRDRVVGAINMDSIPCQRDTYLNVQLGAPVMPFFGNLVIESLARSLEGLPESLDFKIERMGLYFDDYCIADPLIGIPMAGMLYAFKGAKYWHNSKMDMALMDAEVYRRSLAFAVTFASRLANPSKEQMPSALKLAERRLVRAKGEAGNAEHFAHLAAVERRMLGDFDRVLGPGASVAFLTEFDAKAAKLSISVKDAPTVSTPWRHYAAGILPTRRTVGFTQDLTCVPREERIPTPSGVIYTSLVNAIANMDGRKDLARLLREAEYENGVVFSEAEVADYVRAVCFLADWDYLSLTNAHELKDEDVVHALVAAGVRKGDLLLVDADLDSIGHLAGGKDAMLAALREAVGHEGTVLLPAFTPSVRMCRDVNRSWDYRPYDPTDFVSVAKTSPLAAFFLRKNPFALRSAHLIRSWTGFGAYAAECLDAQRPDDSPYSDDSPLAKAILLGGKYVHIGAKSSTDEFCRFLAVRQGRLACSMAVVGVRNRDGTSRDVIVPGCPIGDTAGVYPGDVCISREPLGLSEVGVVELKGLERVFKKAK